jgi:ribosomal protein L1
MPNPKTGGVVMRENETEIKNAVDKLKRMINLRAKENSIKVALGKENGDEEKIAENALIIYNAIMTALPKKKENIRSVMLKFTMSKPVRLKEK